MHTVGVFPYWEAPFIGVVGLTAYKVGSLGSTGKRGAKVFLVVVLVEGFGVGAKKFKNCKGSFKKIDFKKNLLQN